MANVNLLNDKTVPNCFNLNDKEILAIVVEQNMLTIVVENKINTIHLKHIIRVSGTAVNPKKDNYSITIHLSNSDFILVDGMKSFEDKTEYSKCYDFLTGHLAYYNNK